MRSGLISRFYVAVTNGSDVTITINERCVNCGSPAVQKIQFTVATGKQTRYTYKKSNC